jgi:hypothetical protein
MGIREWESGNGNQGMGIREWESGNGDQGMGIREWRKFNEIDYSYCESVH